MCKWKCKHDPYENTDTNDKGQGVSWIGMIISEEQIRLDIIVKCHVSEHRGNKVKEEA